MSVSPTLDKKVVAISGALRARSIPHAFGGAVALGYYGEPRATIDIDINIFVGADHPRPALDVFKSLGVGGVSRRSVATVTRTGQVELEWDSTVIDLFFANHDFHRMCQEHVRDVPLGSETITILGAEDLMIFKIVYNRRKDWLDLEQVLFATAGAFDLSYVRRWVGTFFAADDPRVVELEATIERILGTDA